MPESAELSQRKIQEAESLEKCIAFFHEIGIPTALRKLGKDSFLPGLSIEDGVIVIDKEALEYPGDILHEAGHIAVVPSEDRPGLNATTIAIRENKDAEEMMAIAWSYAACKHLELDPYFVFHEHGYQTGGNYIADNFAKENYFGVPMLQWLGLTTDGKNPKDAGKAVYPKMIKWLRE
jgi:hypothetical protein